MGDLLELIFCALMQFIHKLTRYKCLHAVLYVVHSNVVLLFMSLYTCVLSVLKGLTCPPSVAG